MQIIERGSGPPLVLIPGTQGRWEFHRPTVDALARHFRVITFSLCDEPASGYPFDRTRAAESYVAQIESVMQRSGIARAVICGISFGGVIALRFAVAHPECVDALVLVSTPGPAWHLRPKHELYTRLPWVFGPVFLVESPIRLRREMRAALPEARARWAFRVWMARTFITAPLSPARMAVRARVIATFDRAGDGARLAAPTLVVTGEPGLDHVVPVAGSSEYAQCIKGARAVVLERSGHIGSLTRPDAFADVVHDFVTGQRHVAA